MIWYGMIRIRVSAHLGYEYLPRGGHMIVLLFITCREREERGPWEGNETISGILHLKLIALGVG